ncbi:MAG: hypothetical protein K9M44_03180 [Candidatus Pacebacteria bacterium]|nr:hypothetical protein [Candidatus Paceibacterota bacterium]
MKESSQSPSFGQGLELANIVNKAIASAVKKNNVSSDKIQKVVGKPGQIFDYFDKLFAQDKPEKSNAILSLLSIPETLVLEALDGKATIANAKSTFKSYLDSNFKNWKLDNKGKATEKTSVQVYEMAKDATFSQMFNSLSGDLDSLCLTQNQIISFYEKHPSYLRQDGCTTFFLFKENEAYFVANVLVFSDGLYVRVNHFGLAHVWYAEHAHRLVVPQLNLEA